MKPLALLLAALTWSAPALSAEDFDAALTVSGRKVEVQVRHKDGQPAARVRVRLLHGRQYAVATARTDSEGRWAHTVSQTGAYELLVETGPGEEDTIRLSFAALDGEETASLQTVPALSGLACIAAAVLLVVGLMRKAMQAGARRRWALSIAPLVLLAAGGGLLAWSARGDRPAAEPTGPDVAGTAREFFRIENVKPLSAPLKQLLANGAGKRVPTQPHALLQKSAPEFELADHRGQTWSLAERLERGPVVLVFYFGYHCNHCVGQLFALHDDIKKFRELGAEIVAVSADPPELTRERFKRYGEFAFPVLTDPGNKIARAYGVYSPPSGSMAEELQHGTFVIGRDRRVHWAQYGSLPFIDDLALLLELAELEDRLPPK